MPAKKTTTKKAAPKKKKQSAKKTVAKKAPAKAVPKKTKDAAPVKKGKKTPAQLRGMKDLLPKEEKHWLRMRHAAENIARAYGFGLIETPVLEEASLFIRGIGKGTDVVDKEMYVFEDRDGSKICLRPEFTASVMRAYIGNGMHVQPQPVKLWMYGSLFRHDRPQAGRYRQFRQFDCETIGVHDPAVDAELIAVSYNFLRDLGIESTVHINSIGTPDDRERYLVELVAYLRSKRSYLSDISKKRINKNPLRVLDSKEEQDQVVLEDAPQIIDWLSEASKGYFMKVLEYLDELDIPYHLNPRLVRGLDYYTDTVFELYSPEGEGASQGALCGGGRYNGLVEELGGPETPGCGFAVGLDRVLLELKKIENESNTEDTKKEPCIYFAHLGDQARRRVLALIESLRREGIEVKHNIGKTALKAQLELADKHGASHTLILGQKELQDGSVIIRDMDSGIQEIIDQKKLQQEVENLLKK